MFPVSFVARKMEMVIAFGSVLWSLDRSGWPRCLLWHGWLPGLSSGDVRSSWAASFGQLACLELERCLGAHLVDSSGLWAPPDYWDVDDIAWRCRITLIFGLMVARRIFLLLVTLKWLVLECICLLLKSPLKVLSGALLKSVGTLDWSVAVLLCLLLVFCRLSSVPNSGVPFFALQAYWPCHFGFDNLNVARTMGRLLDRDCLAKPLPLVKDGDLVVLAQYMIRTRGRETATDADVKQGRVRLVDRLGSAEADTGLGQILVRVINLS